MGSQMHPGRIISKSGNEDIGNKMHHLDQVQAQPLESNCKQLCDEPN